MLLFLGFNTSACYATIIGKKKMKNSLALEKWWIIVGLDCYRNRFESRLMSGGF